MAVFEPLIYQTHNWLQVQFRIMAAELTQRKVLKN